MNHASTIDTDKLLTRLIDIGKEAGDLLLAGFGGECAHEHKADASPVTEYDQAAEALIGRHLAADFSGIAIVGEEEISTGHVPPDLGGCFFLVDPLDGTKEFIAGVPDFTVNIALVDGGVPVCGVVVAPAHGELFVGSTQGAFKSWRQRDGVWTALRRIAARERPAEIIALASRSHRTLATDVYLRDFTLDSVIPMGSSLKYCRIAEGVADLYPCLGRTMEWDIAAAHAVLRAAGGTIRDLGGTALRYGKRGRSDSADFANPAFVATGRWDVPRASAS
ncbi:3'(2'),5'-bisphosphate nucleotidase CysQ [Aureimonas sp. SA4125]|uniref:3'(2'),5'-bisphosphate nucleotidase CysQ n=1 Tax=Aureimonas sp. SA4125 TaxID=2826993 RepID=UPI001CC60861|nr:3'(2'),5'-bisphosphate nucleotidase CysQ [Aureimonas sp. SA4125]BDA85984.1 3'(2'),5'-bisphosphate nucleotidase CysQ [Aureimonas sp. SA4125]